MRFEKVENMYLTKRELKILCDAIDLCRIIKTNCSDPDYKEEAINAVHYLFLLYSRSDLDTKYECAD